MYVKRRANLLDSCKKELEKFQNQYNFVEGIIKGALVILGKSRQEVVQALRAQRFKTFEEIYPPNKKDEVQELAQSDDEDEEEVKGDQNILDRAKNAKVETVRNKEYGYLLKLNVMSFTREKLEKLEAFIKEILSLKVKLEASTPEALWLEDLTQFESEYRRRYLDEEDEKPRLFEEATKTIQPVQEQRKVT